MRIQANLTSELDDRIITIRWKNKKLENRLNEVINTFLSKARAVQKKRESGALKAETAAKKDDQILAQFYHDQCDIMFEFEGGTPGVEWFEREDFPVGQMEFLRQVFTNPQMQT